MANAVPAEQQRRAEQLKTEGNEAFKKGIWAEALNKYSEASQLDNSTPVYLANQAACHLKLEEYGSAIAACTDALKIDPNHVKCYYRRAIAYVGTLKYQEAIKDFQKVVALAPNFAEGRTKLQAAQSLKRYTAFQLAIQTEDEPSVLDTLDPMTYPESDGPDTVVPGLESWDQLPEVPDFAQKLIEHFKAGKRVSRRMLFDLICRVSQLFAQEPTMIEITAADQPVYVIGDVHGQFYDVLEIFNRAGFPSLEKTFVFNGDFVDRGSWSTEVAILLYAYKLRYPQNFFMNRGNHETDAMNLSYGFSGECKAKYVSDLVFKAFSESFSQLPLATLINNRYFVVHGGLFSRKGVTLDEIRKLNRFQFKQPGNEGLIMEMLWSDPQPQEGWIPSKRGIAHQFGPDVTRDFLEINNLSGVIRSHECCDNGYEINHGGTCYTIFSAPNYCDQVGNKGAFMEFERGQLDAAPKIKQFDASWHPEIPPMAYASGLMR